MAGARNWCFTLNNPCDQDIVVLSDSDLLGCVYIVFQKEEGDAKTAHIQGYISFSRQNALRSVLKRFKDAGTSKPPHLEIARGTPLQNKTYCTKETGRLQGPWEFGELPKGQGSRTDLAPACEAIKNGEPLTMVALDYSELFVKYHRGLEALQARTHPVLPRNTMPVVSCFFGPTGTGKSARAMSEALRIGGSLDQIYCVDFRANGQIDWSGYEQQKCVIFNDFYGNVKWSSLLKLLDRYPNKVSALYKSLEFVSTHVFFTSNQPWYKWYSTPRDLRPLGRRLCFVREMILPFKWDPEHKWDPTPDTFVARPELEIEIELGALVHEPLTPFSRRDTDILDPIGDPPVLHRQPAYMFSEERVDFVQNWGIPEI